VGEILAAGAAAVTVMAMPLAALLVLTPDDSLPNYPAPTTTGDFNTVGASFPLPGATTVSINEGVPLVPPLDTIVPGEEIYESSTSILADPIPSAGNLPLVYTSGNKGWSLGDPITNLTYRGNLPSWSTVRERYWKNEAYYSQDQYSESNVSRMQQGLAPQRLNPLTGKWESMELHHVIPQREGGLFDVVPVWPDEYARVDPYRYP
jgi:hypothetical protein